MADDFASRLREQEPVAGCWLSVGHPASAELLAGTGYDFVVVDGEHTENTLETIAAMVRAVDAADTDTLPLVRVSSNDPIEVKRVLDLGPAGIIVPAVETADEAEQAVEACKYPPKGQRGVAGYRAANYGATLTEYVESANEDLVTIAQIESKTGVENAAQIAAVDGIDAVFIGPADLSASLGAFGEWASDRVRNAINRVVTDAHAVDCPVGTLATTEAEIERRRDWGVDFMVAGLDLSFLAEGARDHLDTYRSAFSDRDE